MRSVPGIRRGRVRSETACRSVPLTLCVAEREELTETGLGSTARYCGRRRHRQANSVRVCSPTSRRVASLRPRSAGLTALTSAPRTLVQTGSCRRCPLIHPLHVVVAVLSRMTPFPATVDTLWHRRACRVPRARECGATAALFRAVELPAAHAGRIRCDHGCRRSGHEWRVRGRIHAPRVRRSRSGARIGERPTSRCRGGAW